MLDSDKMLKYFEDNASEEVKKKCAAQSVKVSEYAKQIASQLIEQVARDKDLGVDFIPVCLAAVATLNIKAIGDASHHNFVCKQDKAILAMKIDLVLSQIRHTLTEAIQENNRNL